LRINLQRFKTVKFEDIIVTIVFFLYAAVGISYIAQKNYPWALIWFSYALANLGLVWAANSKL